MHGEDEGSTPKRVESRPVEGSGIAAAKLLWRRTNSVAELLLMTVGQLLSVPFVILGMMNATLVT